MAELAKNKIVWLATVAIVFTLTFCAAFAFFFTRRHAAASDQEARIGSDKPLPHADLIDQNNKILSDAELQKGRFVLVFITPDCDACLKESQFLREALSKRADIPFYGVISFGDKDTALREAKSAFPFAVYFDQRFQLAGQLGIKRVPVKLFVDNGVIKKSWSGATTQEDKKQEFLSWLQKL
jgi:peroxiredoxin